METLHLVQDLIFQSHQKFCRLWKRSRS